MESEGRPRAAHQEPSHTVLWCWYCPPFPLGDVFCPRVTEVSCRKQPEALIYIRKHLKIWHIYQFPSNARRTIFQVLFSSRYLSEAPETRVPGRVVCCPGFLKSACNFAARPGGWPVRGRRY